MDAQRGRKTSACRSTACGLDRVPVYHPRVLSKRNSNISPLCAVLAKCKDFADEAEDPPNPGPPGRSTPELSALASVTNSKGPNSTGTFLLFSNKSEIIRKNSV